MSVLQRVVVAAGLAATVLVTSVSADISFGPLSFTTKVQNVRINSVLVEAGKALDEDISVEVRGYRPDSSLAIDDVRKAGPQQDRHIAFVVEYLKTNMNGSVEDIVSFWVPEDRAAKRELLGDNVIFERNRKGMKAFPGLSVLLVMQSGKETIVFRSFGEFVLGMTVVEQDGKLFLKNQATDDTTVAIVEAALTSR